MTFSGESLDSRMLLFFYCPIFFCSPESSPPHLHPVAYSRNVPRNMPSATPILFFLLALYMCQLLSKALIHFDS